MDPILKITDASLSYENVRVFRHLNIQVEPGTVACITGPSGCGKSSLLHAILGIVPLEEGEIDFGGTRLTEESVFALRRKMAWLPQEIALPCEWVREMVQLPFLLKAGRKPGFREDVFRKLLPELKLESSLFLKRVNEISGGQRQRLMIASAVLLHRPLLLIDEPTSALDRESVECVIRLLQRLAGEGSTVLAVSHDATFIEHSDQVIDWSGGQPTPTFATN